MKQKAKGEMLRPRAEPPRWILLFPTVPATPSYARVKTWRRLQAIGAVAIKNAVYVLPLREECVEAFHWLRQDIFALGGQASLCEGAFFDGVTDAEIEQRFIEARAADYAALGDEARALDRGVRARQVTDQKLAELTSELAKLRARFEDVVRLDYFHATGREGVEGLLGGVERELASRRGESGEDALSRPSLGRMRRPRGATWVTRKGVHVDRIASAWLIVRFIDPEARLKFVPAKGYAPAPGELRFDMYEAEFTHVGDRCTFEVLLARMGLDDRGLTALGEIVHDIDLRDGKFKREETAGVRSIITGICAAMRDDDARIAAATPVLDGLHTFFAQAHRLVKGKSL